MVKATVLAFVTREIPSGKQILLTKRSPKLSHYPNTWCLPGGHIEAEETAEEAIVREVREETGLNFNGEFLAYFDEIIPDQNIHAVVIQFIGTATGTIIDSSEEVVETMWLSPLDALSLDLAFQHREVIKQYVIQSNSPGTEAGYFQEISYLRDEILNRINHRNRALNYTIIIAGIFLGLSETAIDYRVIALFPVIGMSMAALWSHHDLRIAQIGRYIKKHIEPNVPGLNWQNYLSSMYYKHRSIWFKKFQEYTVIGIFFLTYATTIFVAIMLNMEREDLRVEVFDYIIIGLNLVAFILTWVFIRRRRKSSLAAATITRKFVK